MSKQITTIDESLLAQLRQNTPVEQGFTRVSLPRLGMYPQDKTEGKGKSMTVIAEAGMFYLEEKQGEEYVKTEIGTDIEVMIAYSRKKLSFYDAAANEFTSSSLFDNDDEVVTLFKAGKKLMSGVVSELQALPEYQKIADDGKVKSKLELNRVLYVIYNGDPYELTIKGTSMWSFSTYAKTLLWSSVLTKLSSTAEKKGTTEWNKMSFTNVRPLNNEELTAVIELQNMIKDSITAEKTYWASREIVPATPVDITAEFNTLPAPEF